MGLFMAPQNGEAVTCDTHGKFYLPSHNQAKFSASANGTTIPANALGLTGTFAFLNPANSGVNAEIISTDIGFYLTAVQNVYFWAYVNIVTYPPTGLTARPTMSGLVGSSVANAKCSGYSAATVPGTTTPIAIELIAAQQTSGTVQNGIIDKFHDGRLIVPPGIGLWLVGNSAGPTAGAFVQIDWVEWPLP